MFALTLSGTTVKTAPVGVFNFIGFEEVAWGPLMAAHDRSLDTHRCLRYPGAKCSCPGGSLSRRRQRLARRNFMSSMMLGVDLGTTGLKNSTRQ